MSLEIGDLRCRLQLVRMNSTVAVRSKLYPSLSILQGMATWESCIVMAPAAAPELRMKVLRSTWTVEFWITRLPGMLEMTESTMARLAAFCICTSAESSAKPGRTSTPLKLFWYLQFPKPYLRILDTSQVPRCCTLSTLTICTGDAEC